jgi:hypothetical protein
MIRSGKDKCVSKSFFVWKSTCVWQNPFKKTQCFNPWMKLDTDQNMVSQDWSLREAHIQKLNCYRSESKFVSTISHEPLNWFCPSFQINDTFIVSQTQLGFANRVGFFCQLRERSFFKLKVTQSILKSKMVT